MTPLDIGVVKVSLVLAVGLTAAIVLRRRSAATRHWMLACALLCAAAVPALEAVVPAWHIGLASVAPTHTEARIMMFRSAGEGDPAAAPADRVMLRVLDRRRTDQMRAFDVATLRSSLTPIWMGGMTLGLASVLCGLFWLWRVTCRARPVAERRWLDAAASVGLEYGVTRPVRLRESDDPALLLTWGLLRPVVILPASSAGWSEERIRVVLCHEFAHIRRGDWLMQTCASLLRAVYWFNPLVWLACQRLRQESEHACDDAVLRHGVSASDYASQLLDIARTFQQRRGRWVPAPAIARAGDLERRVRAMLDAGLNRAPVSRAMCVAIVVAILAAAVPIAGFGPRPSPAVLSGLLHDPAGQPMANSRIDVTNAETGAQREYTTDADGRFEFPGLPVGEYRVTSTAPGARVTFSPRRGERTERNLTIGLTAPLRGPRRLRVTSLDDLQPLRNVGVEGTVEIEGRISSDGVFTDTRVVSTTDPRLAVAALDVVGHSQWDPARMEGAVAQVPLTISIEVRRADRPSEITP